MLNIPRTILATFTALVIALVLDFLFIGSTKSELDLGRYLLVGLFYGFPVLGIGVAMFCIVNYLTHVRIRRSHYKNIHFFYFAVSIAVGLIPIFGFTLFDLSDLGKSYGERTFVDILVKYLPTLVLTVIAALTNWIIVWRRFIRKA
jgi:hypothetical protein